MRNIKTIFLCLTFLLLPFITHAEIAPDNMALISFKSVTDQERYQHLIQEIRCVVCQNQNIADSDALLANDLRKKIEMLIKQQQTNDEIKEYLVKRYGEFILLEPRFNKLTILLWLFPFTGILIGMIGLYFFIRSKQLRA